MLEQLEETLKFIREHRFDNVGKLALTSYPSGVNLPFALSQIAGKQTIKTKIPSWYENDYIIYPKHLSLEQCSSEATARYKASLLDGTTLADLTGGFGVDCAFLAERFQTVLYVEQQNNLCQIAKKNFETLGLNHIQVISAESIDYLAHMPKVDCIYIDPARRNILGEKTVTIHNCEPNIIPMKDKLMSKADNIMIKLSPMLDISLALQSLPETSEIHVVSVNGECKELLFILRKNQQEIPVVCCINILRSGTIQQLCFSKEEEQNINIEYTAELKNYLYEPNASILKAGAYKSIAHKYKLLKLHPDSHLYTSSEYIETFPGRIFKITSTFSLNKREIKENLDKIKQANLSIRNFPGSVDELRKRLKLKEGGNTYLFATTLSDKSHILILCKKTVE